METGTRDVGFEAHGGNIAVITLDRPEKRNAITVGMARSIDAMLKRAEADPAIRVVVIAASGPVFCAGADLAEVAEGRGPDLRTSDGGFAGLVFQPHAKPWIAAVSGPALGGGCEIALACDIILATPNAVFGLPEVRRGLVASAGGLYRLTRMLPQAIAREMIATGSPSEADEARRLGLVNGVVPADALRSAAISMAETIAANAPLAVREALAIARAAPDLDEAGLRRLSRAAADRLFASEDMKEGAQAFLEKRSPQWRGC